MFCGAEVRGGVKKTVEHCCGYGVLVELCCGYGVLVELCCVYGDSGDSIKSLKEYSTPLLLIFATLVSEVGFYKTNTPYEVGDVKKLLREENQRD